MVLEQAVDYALKAIGMRRGAGETDTTLGHFPGVHAFDCIVDSLPPGRGGVWVARQGRTSRRARRLVVNPDKNAVTARYAAFAVSIFNLVSTEVFDRLIDNRHCKSMVSTCAFKGAC